MKIRAILVGAALLAAASPAHADTAFDGYAGFAGGPSSGADAQGNPWSWGATLGGFTPGVPAGYSVWGAPGLGAGENTFNTTTGYLANDFTISFSYFTGASILQTPGTIADYEETTRFVSDIGGVLTAWTASFDGAKSVTFDAPAGVFLANGDSYYVNVVFSDGGLSSKNAGFSAAFSAVPEASTWAMMLAGFGALAFAGYRRRPNAA
jgi:hypothetical protein